jgi:hypothetical protein
MKIGTRERIIRLTAAGIGFALTGAVLCIAVAQSQESIVTQATPSGSYETQAQMKEPGCLIRLSPEDFLLSAPDSI